MTQKQLAARDVFVSTRSFVTAHGHAPRGFGGWAFFPRNDQRIEAAIWVHQSNYGAAKKVAQAQAAAAGISCIVVGS
jgi:hypothetical protein